MIGTRTPRNTDTAAAAIASMLADAAADAAEAARAARDAADASFNDAAGVDESTGYGMYGDGHDKWLERQWLYEADAAMAHNAGITVGEFWAFNAGLAAAGDPGRLPGEALWGYEGRMLAEASLLPSTGLALLAQNPNHCTVKEPCAKCWYIIHRSLRDRSS
jgi:hypothetical protein